MPQKSPKTAPRTKKDSTTQPASKVDEASPVSKKSRSLAVASSGIRTGSDFASMMSALMSDIIEGCVTPQIANAVVNAGGKLLKVTEMQLKYGTKELPANQPFKLN